MNIQSVDVPRRIVHVGHPLKTCVVNVQNWLIAWLQKILVDEDVENQKTSGNSYFRKHVSFALSRYVTRDLLTIHFGEDEIRCRKGGDSISSQGVMNNFTDLDDIKLGRWFGAKLVEAEASSKTTKQIALNPIPHSLPLLSKRQTMIGISILTLALTLTQSTPRLSVQLSPQEREGLLFSREEEKFARDVYEKLAKKWGDRPFSNIQRSEQQHMDAVKGLLDRYGLQDPVAGKAAGEYVNQTLKQTYDRMIARGLQSRAAALRIGAEIEDMDLSDLARLTKQTSNAEIVKVYSLLSKGSRNHLRAFVGALSRIGESYKPFKITQEEFNKIVSSPMERGPN